MSPIVASSLLDAYFADNAQMGLDPLELTPASHNSPMPPRSAKTEAEAEEDKGNERFPLPASARKADRCGGHAPPRARYTLAFEDGGTENKRRVWHGCKL